MHPSHEGTTATCRECRDLPMLDWIRPVVLSHQPDPGCLSELGNRRGIAGRCPEIQFQWLLWLKLSLSPLLSPRFVASPTLPPTLSANGEIRVRPTGSLLKPVTSHLNFPQPLVRSFFGLFFLIQYMHQYYAILLFHFTLSSSIAYHFLSSP